MNAMLDPAARVAAGEYYRHRKGTEYKVLHIGVCEASGAPVVIYRRCHEGRGAVSREAAETVWVRPVAEFCDGRFVHVPNPWDEVL